MATGVIDSQSGFRLNSKTLSAIVLGFTVSIVFYSILHVIHVEAIVHPAILIALPFSAIAWIAFEIPIFMYCAYQDDFQHLNPLNPRHYVQIATRAYKAMARNNYKVTEKDL